MSDQLQRAEALIEEGRVYNAAHLFTAILASNSRYLHVRTPSADDTDLRVFLDMQTVSTILSTLTLYETPTLTGDGTAITPRNFKRDSGDNALTEVFYTPTFSAKGTQIIARWIPAASLAGWGSRGYDSDRELLLKAGESYLLEITDIAGQPYEASMAAVFCERVVY